MPFYERGDVRIRYEEVGSGFPCWRSRRGLKFHTRRLASTGVQRHGGVQGRLPLHHYGPAQRDRRGVHRPRAGRRPLGAFADDQLGLMDHLGIQEFFFIGYCIGGPFAMKLMERAPERVLSRCALPACWARDKDPDSMYNSGHDNWGPELCSRRPELTMETIDQYLHNLYRIQANFVYCVSRDFARSCPGRRCWSCPTTRPRTHWRLPWSLRRWRQRRR